MADSKARVFELRQYTAHPGRMGDLLARFRDHVHGFFGKYEIDVIAYWTPEDEGADGERFIYMLAFESHAQRDAAWTAMQADVQFQAMFAKSEANGPLVKEIESCFLVPADFSPIR
jgi:hypothetical protein